MLLQRSIALRLAASAPQICHQCLNTLSWLRPLDKRCFSTTSFAASSITLDETGIWRKSNRYFMANHFLVTRGQSSGARDIDSIPALPPHRQRQKQNAAANMVIPPDASSLLSSSSAASSSSLRRDALAYLSLSKPRLTALIVLTTMASYALFPVDPLLSSPAAPTLSALTLVYLTAGTALCSSSANALNMAYEPKYDAQMSRTRNRPVVRGLLSTRQAVAFAGVTGMAGIAVLHLGVNPTVAALGALNIFLYAGVYTPMKRISVVNTWVGAIVGGIPPLMGWAAASGATALEGTMEELLGHPGGWLLASLLFAWQFPHFNALSWTIREEYRRAGYQMMVWKYPGLNGRVALRYSLLCFPICFGLWWVGVTDMGFPVDSSFVNAWLVKEAWKFYRKGGDGGRARSLFWASVWHLPLLLGLAMVHKAGMWQGFYERLAGAGQEEQEWDDEGGDDIDEAAMVIAPAP